ncbi:MAG: phenylalanine--tRNA ligase subunit beta [Elusimicrobia bacterium]|nr:phenylalanine--tRNA ligase subunit beta [Elusimicrobiota bacterium]
MKFSYAWLKEFINLDLPPEALSQHLLLIGFEVSSMERQGPRLTEVVAAEILKIEKHPSADRLSLCTVTDGARNFSVVCGAQNIQVGQRVPLARIGATLPGDRRIERAKIRGIESEGMLCSAGELGISQEPNHGIHILSPSIPLGVDIRQYLPSADTTLEVEIGPNRPDCLSHLGLARELSLYFRLPLNFPQTPSLPSSKNLEAPPIQIEAPTGCSLYLGRSFQEIRVKPSPIWLAQRLSSVGLRPINNVVDITNYVLLEIGQPLHAFDQDKLEGKTVRVRWAKPQEKLQALDGKSYGLTEECLVIADDHKPIALAGIIGGEETSITDKTRTVFLESALFSPPVIRKTSKRLKLKTDSSYRFERGVDPQGIPQASQRAAELILKICGTPSLSNGKEVHSDDWSTSRSKPIQIESERLNKILGVSLDVGRVEQTLKALDPALKTSGTAPLMWELSPPSYRQDISTIQDVAEEIGRLLGYHQIPAEPSPVKFQRIRTLPSQNVLRQVQETCVRLGLWEAYNYDFLSQEELKRSGWSSEELEKLPKLENPISSDWEYLRPTLLIGLLRNLKHSLNRGSETLLFFETGKTYKSQNTEVAEESSLAILLSGLWEKKSPVDFSHLKGMAEQVLAPYVPVGWSVPSVPPRFLHPKMCLEITQHQKSWGTLGLLHPSLSKSWKITKEVWFFELNLELLHHLALQPKKAKPFSLFPSSNRDLSFLVQEETPWSSILQHIQKASPAELKSVHLLDIYRGKIINNIIIPKGMKSVTVRFSFISEDRTLTDKEVESFMNRILQALKSGLKARLRGGA